MNRYRSRILHIFKLSVLPIFLCCLVSSLQGQEDGPRLTIDPDIYQICEGETARVEMNITGEPDVWIIYEHEGFTSPAIPNSNNTFYIRLSDPGMYVVTHYGDANTPGSDPPDTFYVNEFPAPQVSFTGGGINCSDGVLDPLVVHFTGEPDFWFTFLFNGEYRTRQTGMMELTFPTDQSFTLQTISLEDANCMHEIDLTANYMYIEVPTPEILGNSLVCEGQTEIYRAAENHYSVSWDIPGTEYISGSDDEGYYAQVTWTDAGDHQVFLRYTEYEYECATDWEILPVSVNTPPEVKDMDTTVCFELEESLDLEIQIAQGDEIYWPSLNSTSSLISLNEIDTYTYILTNANNCSDTGSIRIISTCNPILYVPEAFTPHNGDALNDELQLFGLFTRLDFSIYTPSGVLLFHTTEDPLTYWDGTFEGKDVPVGTYYWSAVYSEGDSGDIEVTGKVSIIR